MKEQLLHKFHSMSSWALAACSCTELLHSELCRAVGCFSCCVCRHVNVGLYYCWVEQHNSTFPQVNKWLNEVECSTRKSYGHWRAVIIFFFMSASETVRTAFLGQSLMLTSVNYGHVSELFKNFTLQSVCHVDGGASSLVLCTTLYVRILTKVTKHSKTSYKQRNKLEYNSFLPRIIRNKTLPVPPIVGCRPLSYTFLSYCNWLLKILQRVQICSVRCTSESSASRPPLEACAPRSRHVPQKLLMPPLFQ